MRGLTYTREGGILKMILGFADKETEKIFNYEFSKKLPIDIQRPALLKLIRLNNVSSIKDLVEPPSNHPEPLSGQRSGQWSIRINRQWRITFTPIDGGANYINVKIEDYH